MKHTKHNRQFDLVNGTPPIAAHDTAWKEWCGRYKLLRDKLFAQIVNAGREGFRS